MKSIDYNPANKIPQIMECDIKNKIIISVMRTPSTKYISFMKYDDNHILHFYGSDIEYSNSKLQRWEDNYNNSKLILELLINEFKWAYSIGWTVRYVIIESEKDLLNFIEVHEIKYHNISRELIRYWKQLQDA